LRQDPQRRAGALAVTFDAVHGIMADAIQGAKNHVRPGQQGGETMVTFFQPAIMVDEFPIVPLDQSAEMCALAVTSADKQYATIA